MCRIDDREMSISLSISYTDFCIDVQSSFITADELLHKFDVFRNSDVRTLSRTATTFRTSAVTRLTHASRIFFSSWLLACACSSEKTFSTSVCGFGSPPIVKHESARDPICWSFLYWTKPLKIRHLLWLLSFSRWHHFVFQGWFK